MGGEGVDNKLDCMVYCGKDPIIQLEIEIILNKSEISKQHWRVYRGCSRTWILLWLLQIASAVPCSYMDNK